MSQRSDPVGRKMNVTVAFPANDPRASSFLKWTRGVKMKAVCFVLDIDLFSPLSALMEPFLLFKACFDTTSTPLSPTERPGESDSVQRTWHEVGDIAVFLTWGFFFFWEEIYSATVWSFYLTYDFHHAFTIPFCFKYPNQLPTFTPNLAPSSSALHVQYYACKQTPAASSKRRLTF